MWPFSLTCANVAPSPCRFSIRFEECEKGASSRRPRVENLAPSKFVPSFRIYLASLPLVAGSCYFSISDDQFKMTDNGAELDVSTFVLTKNFCPSGVTS